MDMDPDSDRSAALMERAKKAIAATRKALDPQDVAMLIVFEPVDDPTTTGVPIAVVANRHLSSGQLTTKRLFDRAVDRFGLRRRGTAPEETTMRHGTTINDKQVNAMLRMFELLDRGGDASTIAKTDPIRRFRKTLIRMRDKSETGKPRNGAAR